MNHYTPCIQNAVAHLGDHLGRVQLLLRNLVESRDLNEAELDPETELAVVCWLEEAADIMGLPRERLFRESSQS